MSPLTIGILYLVIGVLCAMWAIAQGVRDTVGSGADPMEDIGVAALVILLSPLWPLYVFASLAIHIGKWSTRP